MTKTHHTMHPRGGWVEVICGCMFSGKTEEMIRRIRRAQIARQEVIVFKPMIDNRYSETEVQSHSNQSIPARLIMDAAEIRQMITDEQVIGIDEAQFVKGDLPRLVRSLAYQGKRVIAAGLDTDYRGEPFEPVPQLLCEAEFVTKLMAVCHSCGAPAHRTQRLGEAKERILVGGIATYEARCRNCWEPPEDVGVE